MLVFYVPSSCIFGDLGHQHHLLPCNLLEPTKFASRKETRWMQSHFRFGWGLSHTSIYCVKFDKWIWAIDYLQIFLTVLTFQGMERARKSKMEEEEFTISQSILQHCLFLWLAANRDAYIQQSVHRNDQIVLKLNPDRKNGNCKWDIFLEKKVLLFGSWRIPTKKVMNQTGYPVLNS